MQIGDDGAFHLTYCTNIHPGERWDEVQANLAAYVPPLKAALAPEQPFGIGLRLSDVAARTLLEDDHLARFKHWLDERDLYVFTLNGFPYGSFHRERVKDHVYAPDWRTRERVDYTVRLAEILAALLPEGMHGSISTSPISYKPWLAPEAREEALRVGARHLADVTAALVRLRETSGRLVHVDIEPEPDCLIENTEETVSFFQRYLLPEGGSHLASLLGIAQPEAEAHLRAHVQLCYDTCHFAVEYEPPAASLARFREAGIGIGKIQVSAALRVPLPDEAEGRDRLAERLRPFAESTYLHQVVARRADGSLRRYADLSGALDRLHASGDAEWRIHYHVPLFAEDYAGLHGTQPELLEALQLARAGDVSPYLEIETYTWDVLPAALKRPLGESIRREFEWVLQAFERVPG